jgi:hypothetical protein
VGSIFGRLPRYPKMACERALSSWQKRIRRERRQ